MGKITIISTNERVYKDFICLFFNNNIQIIIFVILYKIVLLLILYKLMLNNNALK